MLDGFISLMRREREAVKAQPEKPSIRGQLAMQSVPAGKPAAKTNDREVR